MRHSRVIAADAGVALPVMLVVAPVFLGAPQHYVHWLRRQVDRGHELALQGLTLGENATVPGRLVCMGVRRADSPAAVNFAALGRGPN